MSVGTAQAGTAASSGQAAGAPAARHFGGGVAGRVVLTPRAHDGVSPDTALSCLIYDPEATVTYATGEISWSASTSCNVVLHMYGTTVLYQWGSSSAYAFGNQINGNYSYATSSGAVYGIYSDTATTGPFSAWPVTRTPRPRPGDSMIVTDTPFHVRGIGHDHAGHPFGSRLA